MRVYLTVSEALEIHADQIARYGGARGLRDRGALEAAIARPQSGYYADLVEEAAALWESLAQNHPFVDGNKRVAFAVTDTFLRVNGLLITTPSDDVYAFIIERYKTRTFRHEALVVWLRANTEPVGGH